MRIITWSLPTACWGNPRERAMLAVDIARLARCVSNTLEPMPEIITNATHHDVALLARSGAPVAVDIETAPALDGAGAWTGKDPTVCRLRSIGLGTCDLGMSFMWGDNEGPPLLDMVSLLLRDVAVTKIFHNGAYFDIRVLKRYGMEVRNFHDTRDLRRALVSTSKLSLSYLASIYTDFPAWKVENEDSKDGGAQWETGDKEQLQKYNSLDCVATARAYRGLLRDLENERE